MAAACGSRAPDADGVLRIAAGICRVLRNERGCGARFPPQLDGAALDRAARMNPREVRRVLLAAFRNAKLAGCRGMLAKDISEERITCDARIDS